MVRAFGFSLALVALALLAPADAGGQKKKKPFNPGKSYPKATAADYAALAQKKQLDGKLLAFDVRAQTLVLRTVTPPGSFLSNRKEYELDVRDDVVLRKLNLGVEYDDLGNLKEYTPQQKKALRGPDPSKPGYAAKIDDLQPGQDVTVSLALVKKGELKAGGKPAVRMIVIRND